MTTRGCFRSGLAVALVMIACDGSSRREQAYQRLARDVNPILTAMRPTAANMLALRPDQHAAIEAACTSADEHLRRLEQIEFDTADLDPGVHAYDSPSFEAHTLLERVRFECKPSLVEACSRTCLDYWTAIIDAVEVFRTAARREGVELVSLKPPTD